MGNVRGILAKDSKSHGPIKMFTHNVLTFPLLQECTKREISMSHETPDLLRLACPLLHHMWSWLSPIEWQRKAWLIHISGKNFLTESELCDLALSPTEDTLPFVSPGPILPRSQTLLKCPTQSNRPYALEWQMCQLDCNVNFFWSLPTFPLSLHSALP